MRRKGSAPLALEAAALARAAEFRTRALRSLPFGFFVAEGNGFDAGAHFITCGFAGFVGAARNTPLPALRADLPLKGGGGGWPA